MKRGMNTTAARSERRTHLLANPQTAEGQRGIRVSALARSRGIRARVNITRTFGLSSRTFTQSSRATAPTCTPTAPGGHQATSLAGKMSPPAEARYPNACRLAKTS